jgi:hypothetical protein
VSGAEPPADHQRHLLDEARVSIGQGDHRVRRDLEHHRRLGRLRGRGIGTLLDHRHSAEHLAGAQQLEHHVLAGLRLPDDLHVAGSHEVEPARGVALHEDVAAGAMRLLGDEGRDRVDLARGDAGEHRIGAQEGRDVLHRHRITSG